MNEWEHAEEARYQGSDDDVRERYAATVADMELFNRSEEAAWEEEADLVPAAVAPSESVDPDDALPF